MSAFLPFLAYVVCFAFAPLVYVTAKTVSRAKLKDRTFVKTLTKDYLRTLPVVALVALPVLACPAILRPYAVVLHLVFGLPLTMEMGHVQVYGTRVGINTFYSLFVSNVRETREFFAQNVTPWQRTAILATWLLPPVALAFLPVPVWPSAAAQGVGCGIAALMAMPFVRNLFKGERGKDGYILNPYSNLIVNYFRFKVLYRELKTQIARHAAPPFEGVVSGLPKDEPETYVIVIGESSNAMHQAYCGYPRATNEFTDAFGDRLMRFKGVRSPFAQTIPSLEKTITFADKAHPELVWSKGSLVDYFHDAGFEVYWLSNQYALDDTAITAMTAHADISKCYNFSGMKRFEKAGLDEALLPEFAKYIRGGAKKKAVFLHLIGSHSAYVNRYPDNFRHFEGQVPGRTLPEAKLRFLNAYDDSVRYTDWVIAELVRSLSAIGGASYLLYFADHGEDIYDSTDERILGHSQLANEPMTSVPLMLWTSPRLDELRADIRARYAGGKRAAYGLEDLIHTVLDVSSLTNSDYEPMKSVFNTPAI